MLFNSIEFLLFLPLVFAGYWALARRVTLQNLFVIVASYLFYGWWDWHCLLLIAFTSCWSYVVGVLELKRWQCRPSRVLLVASLFVNLGILGAFKYYSFFVDQAVQVLVALGIPAHAETLQIVLPVGISFYTFQALSYAVDVFRRKVVPTRDPIAFFAFISFFPQLVAGPIERATNLLPQFLEGRTFDYSRAVSGCRQMLWGFFKKCIVADNCAFVANYLLNDNKGENGLAIWLGMFLFSIQIYGDFSGYSDIAIGCSKLFGIKLMRNFAYPYFARDIAEFWRRWHISLTTWFRDYLYIPLGGSHCSTWKKVRNTFVIFLVSGLWHGANWTFVAWGAFHAVLFLPLLLARKNRRYLDDAGTGRLCPSIRELRRILTTFLVAVLGWVFFRARNIGEALAWFRQMLNPSSFVSVEGLPREIWTALLAFVLMMVVEWINRSQEFGLARLPTRSWIRKGIYFILLWIVVFYAGDSQSFIYFQF